MALDSRFLHSLLLQKGLFSHALPQKFAFSVLLKVPRAFQGPLEPSIKTNDDVTRKVRVNKTAWVARSYMLSRIYTRARSQDAYKEKSLSRNAFVTLSAIGPYARSSCANVMSVSEKSPAYSLKCTLFRDRYRF